MRRTAIRWNRLLFSIKFTSYQVIMNPVSFLVMSHTYALDAKIKKLTILFWITSLLLQETEIQGEGKPSI